MKCVIIIIFSKGCDLYLLYIIIFSIFSNGLVNYSSFWWLIIILVEIVVIIVKKCSFVVFILVIIL